MHPLTKVTRSKAGQTLCANNATDYPKGFYIKLCNLKCHNTDSMQQQQQQHDDEVRRTGHEHNTNECGRVGGNLSGVKLNKI